MRILLFIIFSLLLDFFYRRYKYKILMPVYLTGNCFNLSMINQCDELWAVISVLWEVFWELILLFLVFWLPFFVFAQDGKPIFDIKFSYLMLRGVLIIFQEPFKIRIG